MKNFPRLSPKDLYMMNKLVRLISYRKTSLMKTRDENTNGSTKDSTKKSLSRGLTVTYQ